MPFQDLRLLSEKSERTIVSTEVKRYIHNVLVFLRTHRAVASGVTPQATRHFELLAKCLAPLHGLSFVTPSLVALAARKVYRHRLKLVSPEDERSLQYGSDIAAVTAYLKDITVEMVIESVLKDVEVPL